MGLGFVLRRNPEGWDATTDQHPNISDIGEDEWEALFFDVLGCPRADYNIIGDATEYLGRVRGDFQCAIPDYPMLARIYDFYSDVWYKPEEIEQLRRECLKVQSSTSNQSALGCLRLLLTGCDKASDAKLGLFLAAD